MEVERDGMLPSAGETGDTYMGVWKTMMEECCSKKYMKRQETLGGGDDRQNCTTDKNSS